MNIPSPHSETIAQPTRATRSADRDLPLSAGQERLWLVDRIKSGDAAFNLFQVHRLRGPLDPDALARALGAIVDRHESLRATFPENDGVPTQVIGATGGFTLERLSLDGSPDERERRAHALVAARTNQPFDLAQGPLLRASLIRLADDDHVLALVLHHIVADGWSMGVLCTELAALYGSFIDNASSAPLPPLPAVYGDYIHRRRALAEAPEFRDHLDYWTARLAGAPTLDLPVDRPGTAETAASGGTVTHRLPAALRTGVERLARRERVTLYMTLLAAYQTLLTRYCGQDDVCVGSPLAGRDEEEYEPLIGYFVNTLVLRGSTVGDPSFRSFLHRTRDAALAAYAHQDVPFEQLLSTIDVDRESGVPPVFQTMLILRPPAGEGLTLRGLTAEVFESGYRHAKFDLTLEVWPEGDTLVTEFVYDTDRFAPASVERIARCFETLLDGAVTDPDTTLSRLPLLPAAERASTLGDLDGTSIGGTSIDDACPASEPDDVLTAFAAQVARTPHADAIDATEGRLSYAELDARSNRLARLLRRTGVGPESIVAVCAERSTETVVALFAVLKAGGAYLPVDPAHPSARITDMLRDSGAALVLCRTDHADRFAEAAVPVRLLDGEHPDEDFESASVLPAIARPDHLAYVIYTSGSTGRPKGTLITRGALAGRVRWMRERYRIDGSDRVLQFASFGFDTHVEETYPCLLSGGCLVLAPADGLLPELFATDRGRSLTVLDLPTPYWHELVAQTPGLAWPPGLRLVVLGADQADAGAVRHWRDAFGGDVELLNTYGPTEATVIATAALLAGGTDDGPNPHAPNPNPPDANTPNPYTSRPPIGRALTGTRVHVLDRHLEPVPPGVVGELYIGGDGLARGYLARPGLTADRFVPDPHGPPGGRLYRTGDRARQRPDGQLEFLGRTDHQVKIRGYRVELGEIEAALLAHPDVVGAVVVAREEHEDRRLVAYLVPRDAASPPTADRLRRVLARTLPAYLLPAAYVPLDRLPLTVNGKVDRAALPAPDQPVESDRVYLAPRTEAEELVARIYSDVLGRDGVGAFDDFFALGGHSLLATRVAARLGVAIDLTVPIRTLFAEPTVAGLAAAIEDLLIGELDALTDEEAERLIADHVEAGDPR
ncbi:non-ribosomal peptide synthetase [Streptomyces sp. SID3343]|uniref:non-ribosomal peptide synthetase n=1 Tax=Streptomyces sp. SID3343 TaxID=2690260 RepID=UPI001368C343|nr:non-ribosomal peptide synthetase [Streptomyces sp. SID3343]MYW06180.1 amino acid adenylation domain-containing protein [Streptomyces sp. SID3343]